jgi:3-hydroxyisobutyrate dehydrogenase-like beta-hydroxyacid dehydrogenase
MASRGGSVAVLGLGSMGASLAGALSGASHDVVVWNRGVERRAGFGGRATVANSALEACRAAETVAVALYDHPSYMSVLAEDDVASALRGKLVIQFTTDMPEEAERFAAWAAELGIEVLEAAVLAFPADIGTDRALIVYSGPRAIYDRTVAIRGAFGGRSYHAGERFSAASVIDIAVLGLFFGGALAFLQGAELCAHHGIAIERYSEIQQAWVPALASMFKSAEPMLSAEAFDGDQAPLELHRFGAAHVRSAVARAGLHTGYMDAIVEALDRAIGHGHGQHELPAMVAGLRI